MRAFDNGSFFTVLATTNDVTAFAKRWPCFGPRKPLSFEFDKRNGDLVGLHGVLDSHDESGITALAEDCQRYGEGRLGIAGRFRE